MADGFQLIYRAAGNPVLREFDKPRVLIGRSMVCDVVFDSSHLSRKHSEIVRAGDGWMINDLGSRHGVAVNGQIVASRPLAHGDRIALAPEAAEPTLLEFRLCGAKRDLSEFHLHDESDRTSVIASIDLPELAKTLSKAGHGKSGQGSFGQGSFGQGSFRQGRPVPGERDVGQDTSAAAIPGAASFVGSPQLPALSLFKTVGEILLTSETLEDMLQQTASLIGEHLPGRRVAVCTHDTPSGELQPRFFSGANLSESAARPAPQWPRTFPVSRSILREAVRVRRALLVVSAADDPRFQTAASVHQMGIRSAICVPLYHDDHIEGAIYVDSRQEVGQFNSADLEVLTVLGLLVAAGIDQMSLRGDVARERAIRGRLARYNSPQVVERIMQRMPHADDEMQADEYDVSVLFADLGGFTALAERWTAAEVVRFLNAVFERWTADVFAHEGTLDKYIGDAVMAVFGAPLRQPDHARRAVATALAMQRSLDEFNRAQELPQVLTVRIGINSGRVIAGDIGSPRHRAYTVIGDVVNIASRLETSVAQAGQIVIGQATYEQVRENHACEPLGPLQLRGKQQTVEAYRIGQKHPSLFG